MAKLITASIDVTKFDKSKLVTGKKGTYANVTIWVNEEPDQFGNDVSIQQSLSKEEREAGAAKVYLGNGKVYKSNAQPEATATGTTAPSTDLPF